MDAETALQLFSNMLKTGLLVCAPVLGLTLIAGLVISVVQVVTQVQDVSLSFIPKLLVFVVAALLLGPWMLRQLMAFATAAFLQAGHLG